MEKADLMNLVSEIRGYTMDEYQDRQKYSHLAEQLVNKAHNVRAENPKLAATYLNMAQAFREISEQEATHQTREEKMLAALRGFF